MKVSKTKVKGESVTGRERWEAASGRNLVIEMRQGFRRAAATDERLHDYIHTVQLVWRKRAVEIDQPCAKSLHLHNTSQ